MVWIYYIFCRRCLSYKPHGLTSYRSDFPTSQHLEDIFWCGYVSILWIRLNLVDTSQSCLNLLCIARRLTYAWVIYISSFLSTGTSCRQSMLSAKYISFLFLVYVHGNFAHDHHVLSSIVRPFCVLLFIVFTLSCIVFSAYSRPLWAASYFDKDTERVLLGVSRFIEIFGLPNWLICNWLLCNISAVFSFSTVCSNYFHYPRSCEYSSLVLLFCCRKSDKSTNFNRGYFLFRSVQGILRSQFCLPVVWTFRISADFVFHMFWTFPSCADFVCQ